MGDDKSNSLTRAGTEPSTAVAPRRASIGARRNPASAEAILSAAEAILKEHGAGGFSIEAVARRAGAGKPTVYRWWPNKAALLLDIYARQKLNLPSYDTGSLAADLQIMMTGTFRFWATTAAGQVFRSIIAEAQSDPSALQALRSYMAVRIEDNVAVFERARARGELAADADSAVLGELVSSYLWERLLLDQMPNDPEEIANVIRHIAHRVSGKTVKTVEKRRPERKARAPR